MRTGYNRSGTIVYEDVYVTYNETSDHGGTLISCLRCGQIYIVDVAATMYECPLPEKLKQMACISCGDRLSKTYADYPYRYRASDGVIEEFEPPFGGMYPPDSLGVFMEFPSIYDW